MLKLTVGLALVALVACLQCPEKEVCEGGQTCCQTPTGETSCCPFHHGECCEDHLHCCPEGMLCKVMESMCWNETDIQPWVERTHFKKTSLPKSFRMIPSLPASENEITCPDGSYCPAEFSCLLMSTSYGCCPVAQGIVCSDGKHCCPKDHECSADSSSCLKLKVETVLCGDEKSECPVDSTCCETEVDGQWACCPMPKAVCCDDKVHCCPEDSVCDVKSSRCMSSTNQELPMWTKFSARLRAEWEDHKPAVVTPEMNTKAEPTTNGQTTTALNKTAFLENSDVPCDDTVACPDDSTCCKTKEGGWACCPLPQAVCCDDFIHCCPTGKKCNVAAGTCEDPSGSVPWFEKVPVQPISSQNVADTQDSDVSCNATVACPDESTCCKTKEGGWACCPLPQAVCCDDFVHCCPTGKKCNVAAGTCEDPSCSVPWSEQVPVQPISSQNLADTKYSDVPCDDTVACPDDSTCCKTKEGGWACCPLPQAVCCDDFIHCCPTGKKCNVAAETCEDPSGSVPWFEKVPGQPISSQKSADTQDSDVPCDDTVACPDDSTCCKTKEGGWACCPLPQAVCCDDFIHCCPTGKKCNVAAGTCEDPSGSVPWLEKVSARLRAGQRAHANVSCDSNHICPESNTCCKNRDGDWNCCPMPEAVCCKDGEHCCPAHYECDVGKVSCIKKDVVIPWYNKIPAQSTPAPSSDRSTVACDEQFSCSAETTCCRLFTGKWGCCPLPEAVCCPDHEHCCPKDYTCDMGGLSCVKHLWLELDRVPLTQIDAKKPDSISSVKDIQCGGGFSCPDGETCCPTSKTTWACCSSPQAVCCDDMKHCCPNGYTCGEGGFCIKAKASLKRKSWRNWNVFFSQKK